MFKIKAGALILNLNLKLIRVKTKLYTDLLVQIILVSVSNSVNDDLTDCHLNKISRV